MADTSFPSSPAVPRFPATPAGLVVRREALLAIRESLAISIHDLINDPRRRKVVLHLYRITRRIEDEAWLRRRLEQLDWETWVASHL